MNQTFQELFRYLKHPVLESDTEKNRIVRFKKLFQLLAICFITGIIITPLFAIIEEIGLINMENHAIEDLIKNYSKFEIFMIAAVAAPIFEELIFRGPLTLFKKPKTFKMAFYAFTLVFGFIHITNFEMTQNVLLLSPILVLPQILLGGYLGFIRVRYGLIWSIGLHALYNGVLVFISFFTDIS